MIQSSNLENFNIDRSDFKKGYKACLEDLSSKVKKLGKKYYKEFIDGLKDSHLSYYTSSTSIHKCNCKYCAWDIKK